jgi:hypothetical protein
VHNELLTFALPGWNKGSPLHSRENLVSELSTAATLRLWRAQVHCAEVALSDHTIALHREVFITALALLPGKGHLPQFLHL